MTWTTVADIKPDAPDAVGLPILEVYTRQPPYYAVYRTKDRVMVQWADDQLRADAQRASMVRLNPLRGDINNLIDGWHTNNNHRKKAAARRYDRRVADAINVVLEGDIDGGVAILTATKTDLIEERTSIARFQYLLMASAGAGCAFLFGTVFSATAGTMAAPAVLAALSGTIGAFFSIALAIRSRTILTDLHFRSNATDAVLRIIIGAIAAAVLYDIEILRIVSIFPSASHDAGVPHDPGNMTTSYNLLIGFLAGFSERLIPDLLAKIQVDRNPTPSPRGPNTATRGAPGAGEPASTPTTPPPLPAAAANPDPDAQADHCLCAHPVATTEATPDTELPPATGGVAGSV